MPKMMPGNPLIYADHAATTPLTPKALEASCLREREINHINNPE